MQPHNRNILIAVIAVVLLFCCCVTVFVVGIPIYTLRNLDNREAATTEVGEPVVVEEAPTVTPIPFSTERPLAATSAPAPTRATSSPTSAAVDAEAEFAQVGEDMPPRDLRELALRLKPHVGDIPAVVNAVSPVYKVGDTAEFWVSNNDTMEHRKITATLAYITDHVYVWVEDGVKLSLADLKKSADRFEGQTYPTDRAFFGSER